MLTKLLPRSLPQSRPSSTAPKASLPARPALSTTAPRIQNTAVRTLQGASVFESARNAKPVIGGFADPKPFLPLGGLPELKPGDLGKHNPRREAIEQSLATGATVPFTNTDGKTEQVYVQQIPGGINGDSSYVVRVGDDQFTVTVEAGADVDVADVVTQVVDSYSETPEDLRGSLNHVVIKGKADPGGAAATANSDTGTITFYGGEANVTEDIFHHEIGHLIGRQVEDANDTFLSRIIESVIGQPPGIPDGWSEAAAADGNHLNEYTEESFEESGTYTEDFAEAWSEYMRAIDQGPEALEKFEETYPERSKILEDIYPPPA
ncbi:hypothetical protein JY651_22960 [Pyxidicoccus parkwayensis]|uniref:Uncharacterized protein n=1 Tax=Pyxidicoccus parkwayensis TaxID=2813578 RepID=A0ABX7PB13_9BACT|nr:hypothetical protein [Pyxidicoccus parkwaysis]QSQ27598.1 hypothetical protein JY651_22960 [Pyxidicoccus parkwaysis]